MYYARLVHYKLGREKRSVAEEITKKFDKLSRNLKGFRGSVYFFDDVAGEYRGVNYWDTKEHAENANKVLFPELEKELQQLTHEKPTYKFFEVYDPTDERDLLFSHTIK